MTKRPDGPKPATSVQRQRVQPRQLVSVSPPQGRAPAVLTVTVAPLVMSAGAFSGEIMVGVGGSSVAIPVTLTVTTLPVPF
jgi:hypothetical protein